jgi:beta-glucanase (GH16 family)
VATGGSGGAVGTGGTGAGGAPGVDAGPYTGPIVMTVYRDDRPLGVPDFFRQVSSPSTALRQWGDTAIVGADTTDFAEGTQSLAVRYGTGGGGIWFSDSTGAKKFDLLALGATTLKFDVKAPPQAKAADVTIKLESATTGIHGVNLSSYATFSGAWEHVSIPLGHFQRVDLKAVTVVFGAHGKSGQIVKFDNIRFEKGSPDDLKGPWKLAWADEFNGAALDETVWSFELGGGGWGNQEVETYTRTNLVFETGADGAKYAKFEARANPFTSARITTSGKKSFQFGRLEARMMLPNKPGLWPAMWMLGTSSGNWPLRGEIDIAEGKGRLPRQLWTAIHRGSGVDLAYSTITTVGVASPPWDMLQIAGDYSTDWHLYAIEWQRDDIDWFVDAFWINEAKQNLAVDGPSSWPFNAPFFLILDLAMGGTWDNMLAPSPADLPQSLKVDYVRWYQK